MVKCGREGELSASACFCRIWLELIRADPGYGGSKVSNGKSSCRRLCILPGRCNKSKGHLIRLFFFGCFSTKHVNVSLGPAISGVFKYSKSWIRLSSWERKKVVRVCDWLIWKDLLEKLVEDKDIWGMVLNWILRASLNFEHQTVRRRRSGLGVNASTWRIERVRAGREDELKIVEMGGTGTQSLKPFRATIALQREAWCSWILSSDPTGCYNILAEVWVSKLIERDY